MAETNQEIIEENLPENLKWKHFEMTNLFHPRILGSDYKFFNESYPNRSR